MSVRRLSVVVALLVVPAVVFAQRGGGGGGNRNRGGGGGGGGGGGISTKDLQKENLIPVIIDNRKELKLSDAELKELKTLDDRAKDSTKSHLKAIDSIADAMKKGGDEAPTSGQKITAPRYTELHLTRVREWYDLTLKEAISKLTEEHQKQVDVLLKDVREEQAAARKKRP